MHIAPGFYVLGILAVVIILFLVKPELLALGWVLLYMIPLLLIGAAIAAVVGAGVIWVLVNGIAALFEIPLAQTSGSVILIIGAVFGLVVYFVYLYLEVTAEKPAPQSKGEHMREDDPRRYRGMD